MCDLLLDTEKDKAIKELFKIEQALLELHKPKNFYGTESYEVTTEKNFQYLCHALNSHTNQNVKEMSVIEAYSLMEMLKNNQKQNGRQSD